MRRDTARWERDFLNFVRQPNRTKRGARFYNIRFQTKLSFKNTNSLGKHLPITNNSVLLFIFSYLCVQTIKTKRERERNTKCAGETRKCRRGLQNKCLNPKENSTQDDKQAISCRSPALVAQYITLSCSRSPQTLKTIQVS